MSQPHALLSHRYGAAVLLQRRQGICETVEQDFAALEKQFNSLQHQAQARTYLTNFTIEGIRKEKNCTLLQALETAQTRICDIVPNCGKECQQTSHYCDFLQKMVERQTWAKAVIQARLTPGPNSEMAIVQFMQSCVRL